VYEDIDLMKNIAQIRPVSGLSNINAVVILDFRVNDVVNSKQRIDIARMLFQILMAVQGVNTDLWCMVQRVK
jgi:hypothetical protein